MRFREFNKTEILDEGGKSGAVRYNSEVGMLAGFCGVDPNTFDPKNPADPNTGFAPNLLGRPDQVYKDIKNLVAPNFDVNIFAKWADIGKSFQQAMSVKLNHLGTTVASYGWAGGANIASGVADIAFEGSAVAGVSIKAEGGITLANLTPKVLGLTPERGSDIFYHYAQAEYVEMKSKIFNDVLELAKQQPGQALDPMKQGKYTITYDQNTDQFTCTGKKTITATADKILGAVAKNAKWQRVFGDWFQANWASKKAYAQPLYEKLASVFEKTIESSLVEEGKLSTILRFGKVPYFYATPTNLYFVPSIDTMGDLQVMGLKYGRITQDGVQAADGTSQLFVAQIGVQGSKEFAELDIYIRYANGMFESNPTVRIQNLRNPQFISWEQLV